MRVISVSPLAVPLQVTVCPGSVTVLWDSHVPGLEEERVIIFGPGLSYGLIGHHLHPPPTQPGMAGTNTLTHNNIVQYLRNILILSDNI